MGGLLQFRGWVVAVVVVSLFLVACAPSSERGEREPEAAPAETRTAPLATWPCEGNWWG